MKTMRKTLAVLMAVCMVIPCSMAAWAEEGEETPVTPALVNYLTLDESFDLHAKVYEDVGASEKTAGNEDNLPEGNTSYLEVNGGGEDTQSRCYQTSSKIPASGYVFCVWYKASAETASIRFNYVGAGNKKSKTLGQKNCTVRLPATGESWEQILVVWDAAADTKVATATDVAEFSALNTGKTMTEGTTYMTDKEGAILYQNTNGGYALQPFSGGYVYLQNDGGAEAPAYFCDPVLTPFDTDIVGSFGAVSSEVNDEYGSGDAVYNILGVTKTAASAGEEVAFKFASANSSAADAKMQDGQVILAAYDETGAARQLTDVAFYDFTEGLGGTTCTVPEAFAGKTLRACFWASDGTVQPLGAPVSVSVTAAASTDA